MTTTPTSSSVEITAVTAAFVAALEDGKAAVAAAAYAADARLLPPSSDVVVGRSAIEAYWRAGLDTGVSGFELVTDGLDHRGDVAFEVGRYVLRLDAADGEVVSDRGRYAVVHERQDDGSWLRAVEMFSPDAAPGVARADPAP